MKYSIVTPNYNGFSLMKRYFTSLENQIFKDFEVIIVDDCSTDNSYCKLVEYAKSSTLDISILKSSQNAGPGNARNIGMDKAKGKWITFIDNDDWVETTFLEEIDAIIIANEVNCIIFDYYVKSEKKQVASNSMYKGEEEILTLSECMMYVRNHSVGKVYNLEKCRINNVYYPKTRRCEDVAFVARAIDACGSAYYYKRPLYYYYQRKTSLSNNNKMNANDMIKAFAIIEEKLGTKYYKEIYEKSVTDLLYGGVLMMCKAGEKGNNIKKYIDWYESKYPNWKNTNIINEVGKSKKMYFYAINKKSIFLLKLLTIVHSALVG